MQKRAASVCSSGVLSFKLSIPSLVHLFYPLKQGSAAGRFGGLEG